MLVVDYLAKQFKETTGVDVTGDKIAKQRLKEAAEQAKKELSSSMSATVQLPYLSLTENGPANLDETITRAKFEELTADLLSAPEAVPGRHQGSQNQGLRD
jgi:molecular chaperone DnaK